MSALRPSRISEVSRGARAAITRWAGLPVGRVAVAGLVIAAMLAVAGVAGAFVIPDVSLRTTAETAASGSGIAEEPAPPSAATQAATTPSVHPSGSTGRDAVGRPADAYIGWAQPVATKLDIPSVALEAYAYAELVLSQTRPSCKLSWTLLAGVGKIESNHGRTRGAQLDRDGKAAPPIIGAPLDGQSGRKAIPDTDSGRLDGDRTWDRAVGPMQFLPATWQRYAIDADGDLTTDVNDLDDASLASAEYLCAGGRDLSTPEGWYGAVESYNAPATYQQDVFNAANDYGQRSRA